MKEMKRIGIVFFNGNGSLLAAWAGMVLLSAALAGCDSSSSAPANAEVRLNFSGTYVAGDIVPGRSGGAGRLTRLVLQGGGEALTVSDSNGSVYRGRLGEILFDGGSLRSISANEVLAHAHIEFSGRDEAAERTVEFAGTLRAIALTDIQGRTQHAQGGGSAGEPRARHVFALDAGNTVYELQGNWIEQGGRSLAASARAPAQRGEIIIHSGVTGANTDEGTGDGED